MRDRTMTSGVHAACRRLWMAGGAMAVATITIMAVGCAVPDDTATVPEGIQLTPTTSAGW